MIRLMTVAIPVLRGLTIILGILIGIFVVLMEIRSRQKDDGKRPQKKRWWSLK